MLGEILVRTFVEGFARLLEAAAVDRHVAACPTLEGVGDRPVAMGGVGDVDGQRQGSAPRPAGAHGAGVRQAWPASPDNRPGSIPILRIARSYFVSSVMSKIRP